MTSALWEEVSALFARELLRQTLRRIDGKPYGAYRDLSGSYDFGAFHMHIEYVQADPYAPPSRLRIRVPAGMAMLDAVDWRDPVRRVALEDFLLRRLFSAVRAASGVHAKSNDPARVSPPAGQLHVVQPGQQVLERSACTIASGAVDFRLACNLPAIGRTVQGSRAAAALDIALPSAITAAMRREPADLAARQAHIALRIDQEALRATMAERGWIAFVANGSVLPRENGTSDRPMGGHGAIPFLVGADLDTTVHLPHRGEISGLAIPAGITAIVGGAYHGKSTLLRALERGVYDHIAGDGREFCLTRQDAVTIAIEDGRPVSGVDIAPFVAMLPGGRATQRFSTDAASGSTSQAAGLSEALEAGSRLLLLDEDRSAANFLARDRRMRRLIPAGEEPVTPLVDRARWLFEVHGVSLVLAVGGSGQLLDVADRVLRLREYLPSEVTAEVATIRQALPEPPTEAPTPDAFGPGRIPRADPFGGAPDLRVRVRGSELVCGETVIDLGACSQLVEEGQFQSLAQMLRSAARYTDGRRTLTEIVSEVMREIDRAGMPALSPWDGRCPGDYVRVRPFELAAAINRFPALPLVLPAEPEPVAPPPRERRARRTV